MDDSPTCIAGKQNKTVALLMFGRYRLDSVQGILFRDGYPVPLVPKAVRLLQHLLVNSRRAVRKQELMSAVWPDSAVEEGNLAKLIFILRKALGESVIQTVPCCGYRLAVPVIAADQPGTDIIAVMPMISLQPGDMDEELQEGIVEEIIACAAALPNVRVIARSSSFRLAGSDVRDIGARLSATLVFEGRVRKSATGYRVSLQVADTRAGLAVWTASFEGPADDVAALKYEVSRGVAKWLESRHTNQRTHPYAS